MICVTGYRSILTIVYIIVLICTRDLEVESRAIMVEPPHRSSLWRFNYNTTVNLRDDNLNCGGYDWQWRVHQGRCGVCGDLWNGTQHNADRGQYDTGIIVRRYTDGHYINVTFEVSSNYLGFVEFRLCPRNSTSEVLDQSCFDRYPLWIDESHGTRYYIGSRGGIYDIHIRLPGGLVCKKCVLQWKYKTGYRYNGDDSCKCLGCGKQEQYVNCADIEISPTEGWPKGESTLKGSGRTDGSIPRFADTIQPTRTTQTDPNTTINEAAFIPPPLIQSSSVIDFTKVASTSYLTSSRDKASLPVLGNMPTVKLNLTSVDNVKASAHTSSPHLTVIQSTRASDPFTSLMTLPPAISPSVSAAPPIRPRVITLDDIRRQIVRKLGSEVANGMKVFFSPPKETGQTPRPATQRPHVGRLPVAPQRPEVPNTQFVSVSNILDRFYPNPNYITPLLFSLAQPNASGSKTSNGCDVTSDEFRCKARGIYNQSPGISKWCEINCRASNCVTFMCECSCEDKKRSQQNTSCHAIAEFHGVEGMDQWCIANCKVGYCPANTCSVDDCVNKSTNGEA